MEKPVGWYKENRTFFQPYISFMKIRLKQKISEGALPSAEIKAVSGLQTLEISQSSLSEQKEIWKMVITVNKAELGAMTISSITFIKCLLKHMSS